MDFLKPKMTYNDAPECWQISVQDPASPSLEGMIVFHNYLLFFLISMGIAVMYFLYVIFYSFEKKMNKHPSMFTHSNTLEMFWTMFPSILLLFMAVPSFSLLYSLDDLMNPTLTLKMMGHQWYWSYEYSDVFWTGNEIYTNGMNFDSYISSTDDLRLGEFRLLEVDSSVVLPVLTHISLLMTSADVLHSWAVPSFGIKVDACPGRLSEASLFLKSKGIFFGQCSEICGVNHGFMPIVVESVSKSWFLEWRTLKMTEFLPTLKNDLSKFLTVSVDEVGLLGSRK